MIGAKGSKLIKHYESLHDGDLSMIGLQPKMCPAGIWTEGWGHAMVYQGRFLKGIKDKELAYKLARISDPNIDDEIEAENLFLEDVGMVELVVNRRLKIKLNQDQLDALISHVFNCGVSETLFKLINTKPLDSKEIKDWWENKYITAGGVFLQGLKNRRLTEYKLFSTGILNI